MRACLGAKTRSTAGLAGARAQLYLEDLAVTTRRCSHLCEGARFVASTRRSRACTLNPTHCRARSASKLRDVLSRISLLQQQCLGLCCLQSLPLRNVLSPGSGLRFRPSRDAARSSERNWSRAISLRLRDRGRSALRRSVNFPVPSAPWGAIKFTRVMCWSALDSWVVAAWAGIFASSREWPRGSGCSRRVQER